MIFGQSSPCIPQIQRRDAHPNTSLLIQKKRQHFSNTKIKFLTMSKLMSESFSSSSNLRAAIPISLHDTFCKLWAEQPLQPQLHKLYT
eukprot:403375379